MGSAIDAGCHAGLASETLPWAVLSALPAPVVAVQLPDLASHHRQKMAELRRRRALPGECDIDEDGELLLRGLAQRLDGGTSYPIEQHGPERPRSIGTSPRPQRSLHRGEWQTRAKGRRVSLHGLHTHTCRALDHVLVADASLAANALHTCTLTCAVKLLWVAGVLAIVLVLFMAGMMIHHHATRPKWPHM